MNLKMNRCFEFTVLMRILVMAARVHAMDELKQTDRVVFLGDSITDGFTYPLLIQQALKEAGRSVPMVINAGAGGDTAEMMCKRLDRDVLSKRPTLVAFSAGANDTMFNVSLDTYKTQVTRISDRLKSAGIPMLILTTTVFGPTKSDKEKRLEEYNSFLRGLAKESGYRVADVNAVMQAARKNGDHDMHMPDDVHLSYHGYELMTQAVLEGLGYSAIPLPKQLTPPPYDGLIPHWKIRPIANDKDRLNEKSAADIHVDDDWKDYDLPEKSPLDGFWTEHERQRGTALSLEKVLGKAPHYLGTAILDEPADRDVVFKIGASLQTLWLNGNKIYASSGAWHGWHLGSNQAIAKLKAGKNTVVIETGKEFILTVTASDE